MITVSDVVALRRAIAEARGRGQRIGLVPTMGCLHDGHRALIAVARRRTDFVVVSIFINPTQFGPSEDFDRYPRTLAEDAAVCRADGVDLLFQPAVTDVYAPDHSVTVEETVLSHELCGRQRPGHFRGVTTVVAKLFNMVQPDVAVFGQKDAQQAVIVRRMVRDLNFPVQIDVAPTIREADGLAMSSRNRHLDSALRRQAAMIYQALREAVAAYRQGERDSDRLQQALVARIESQPGLKVEYAVAVDDETFEPSPRLSDRVRLVVAVRAGHVRLIDNERLIDLDAW